MNEGGAFVLFRGAGMANERNWKVARIDKGELTDMAAEWSYQERGLYLRFLLHGKGIDPQRLYRTEYYPDHRCWLLLQEETPATASEGGPLPARADERLYLQAMTEFRRAARAAWAAQAARSPHFARHGKHFQPPGPVQEMTPAELAQHLGGGDPPKHSVHFTTEGGWRHRPSGN
jgi:hypothetical protein